MRDLTAQRAIVIGGSSGVGMAAAKALCESGLEVIVTGRDETKLEAARRILGPQGRAERVDATSEEAVRAFFGQAGSFTPLVPSLGTLIATLAEHKGRVEEFPLTSSEECSEMIPQRAVFPVGPTVLLTLLFHCVACSPAPSAKDARSTADSASQARASASSCPQETLAPAQSFAQQHPNDPEAQARLAEAYRGCFARTQDREDVRRAADSYTKAALLSSQSGNLRYTRELSELLVQAQDKTGLQESFGKILNQVPADRQYVALLDYADGLASLGDPTAWTYFDKAVQQQPAGTVEAVDRYARQLIDHGEARKAVALLQDRLTPEQRIRFRLPAHLLREALQKAGMDTASADAEIARADGRRPGRTRSQP